MLGKVRRLDARRSVNWGLLERVGETGRREEYDQVIGARKYACNVSAIKTAKPATRIRARYDAVPGGERDVRGGARANAGRGGGG